MSFEDWMRHRLQAIDESYVKYGIGLVPVPCPADQVEAVKRAACSTYAIDLAPEYLALLALSNGASSHATIFAGTRHTRLDRGDGGAPVLRDDDILTMNAEFLADESNAGYFAYGYHDLGWLVFKRSSGDYWVRKGDTDWERLGGAEEMIRYALA